ncbi:hypothetical protein FVE85_4397 [Porphyridium purpureum]|uniref:Pentatricopeptide repeat-containing protein n=1 Tax=Porphyridium purpureum TaxID=35688 RepID=A0A5J4YGX6_PORPP|nr:hypothetical protein FVE85_4397 [Porphyridium purpureum]|eukprot:POR4551..scf270_19
MDGMFVGSGGAVGVRVRWRKVLVCELQTQRACGGEDVAAVDSACGSEAAHRMRAGQTVRRSAVPASAALEALLAGSAQIEEKSRPDAIQCTRVVMQRALSARRPDVALRAFQTFVKGHLLRSDSASDQHLVALAMVSALQIKSPKRAMIIYRAARGAALAMKRQTLDQLVAGLASNRWVQQAMQVHEENGRFPLSHHAAAACIDALGALPSPDGLDHAIAVFDSSQALYNESERQTVVAALIRACFAAGLDVGSVSSLLKERDCQWHEHASTAFEMFRQTVQLACVRLTASSTSEAAALHQPEFLFAGARKVLLKAQEAAVSKATGTDYLNTAMRVFVELEDPVGAAQFLRQCEAFRAWPELARVVALMAEEHSSLSDAESGDESEGFNAQLTSNVPSDRSGDQSLPDEALALEADTKTVSLLTEAAVRSDCFVLEMASIVHGVEEMLGNERDAELLLAQSLLSFRIADPRHPPLMWIRKLNAALVRHHAACTASTDSHDMFVVRILDTLAHCTFSGSFSDDSEMHAERRRFRSRVVQMAQQCFDEMCGNNGDNNNGVHGGSGVALKPTRAAYHALFRVFESGTAAHPKAASALLDNMHLDAVHRPEVAPCAETYAMVVRACTAVDLDMRRAMFFFDDLVSRGISPNAGVYAALIRGFGQKLQLEEALQVWRMARSSVSSSASVSHHQQQQSSLLPAPVVCEAMVECCMQHPRGIPHAIALLEEMHSAGMKSSLPVFACYDEMISSCRSAQDMRELLSGFSEHFGNAAALASGDHGDSEATDEEDIVLEDSPEWMAHESPTSRDTISDLTLGAILASMSSSSDSDTKRAQKWALQRVLNAMKVSGKKPNQLVMDYFALDGRAPLPKMSKKKMRFLRDVRSQGRGKDSLSEASLTQANNASSTRKQVLVKLRQAALREFSLLNEWRTGKQPNTSTQEQSESGARQQTKTISSYAVSRSGASGAKHQRKGKVALRNRRGSRLLGSGVSVSKAQNRARTPANAANSSVSAAAMQRTKRRANKKALSRVLDRLDCSREVHSE